MRQYSELARGTMKQYSTFAFFWNLAKALRVRQWMKNFALFAGIIFSGQLTNPLSIRLTFEAFILFCAASSSIYLLNDVFDIERDKLHPFKSKRPIAAGELPVNLVVGLALILIAIVLPVSYVISPPLFLAILAYLILQLFYSAYLKSIILIDIMAIAAGFLLRIYAGVWVIDAHLNVWFLLTVLSFALFLAIGKRRSELTLLQGQAAKHRETLLHYPESLLDILTSMFANSTWLAYAIFTFFQPTIAAKSKFAGILNNFTLSVGQAKYLMITVPIVIYGVMRYLYIIYEKKQGESPERVLLTDRPLLISVLLWLTMVIGLIYYLGV